MSRRGPIIVMWLSVIVVLSGALQNDGIFSLCYTTELILGTMNMKPKKVYSL